MKAGVRKARTAGPTLLRRHNTWYIRFYVPGAHQERVGKKEITRTLGTQDKREAVRRLHVAAADLQEQLGLN